MKNVKLNVGSFATAKLQAKMRIILAIIAFAAVIGFSMAACGGGDGKETPPLSAFAGTWNASNGRSIYITDNWFEYKVITDKPYEGNFSKHNAVDAEL